MERKVKKLDLFTAVCTAILIILTLVCLLPIVNVLAISFSGQEAIASGKVGFGPVDITLMSYKHIMNDVEFFKSLYVSLKRVLIGPFLNLVLIILCSYPLSKSEKVFPARNIYVWVLYFATLFGGGLVPTYMVVKETGLLNSFWALIIPESMQIGYIIMMMNFFRNLPKELEEAALVDGASQWRVLCNIYLPLSKASIATITLFCIILHWNEWFSGVIYFYNRTGQPMATYLHNIIMEQNVDMMATMDIETIRKLSEISVQSINAAKITMAMLPILLVYPFLRKYFAQGIVMGSVKG